MTAQTRFFAIAISVLLVVLLGAGVYALRRVRQLKGDASLNDLLQRLTAVDRAKVALVAGDYGAPGLQRPPELPLESWQIAELIGGMEGMEALASNCDVLIALAYRVQQWYPEALPVAEQLRLNAREVQWHLERLRGAEHRGNLESVFPDYAQRAVAIYFGMTQHVLALYESTQVAGLAEVQAVLAA